MAYEKLKQLTFRLVVLYKDSGLSSFRCLWLVCFFFFSFILLFFIAIVGNLTLPFRLFWVGVTLGFVVVLGFRCF